MMKRTHNSKKQKTALKTKSKKRNFDKAAGKISGIDKRLKVLFDYAPDAYYLHDMKGRFIECNKAAEDLLGYKRNELIGKDFRALRLLAARQASKINSLLQDSSLGKPTGPDDFILNHRSGKQLTVKIKTFPVKIKGRSVVLVIARDFTQPKSADTEIKSLADFTQENPQPALRISKDGTLLYANATSAPLRIEWGSRIGEEVPDEWRQLVSDVLKSGLRQNVEVELRGQVFSFVVVPIGNAYVNLYGRDVTDRKRAEEKLQKAYTELKDTQSQLIQAEKMNVVGRLASGVAHEVKNPLAIILQGIDYLAKNIDKEDKNVVSILKYMEEAVRRADGIIRGLLDFGGLPSLHTQLEDLNSTIEHALTLVKHSVDKNHIDVVKDLANDLPNLKIDKNRIQQVFVNLFINAINAMSGGGTLKVRTYTEYPADSKLLKDRGLDWLRETRIVVEVEDTGSGIPADIIDKVFDPFFTTNREKGGAGLGLSIVRNIIEMHNGNIEIKNRKEGGVRVRFFFKIIKERGREYAKEKNTHS